MTRPEKTRSRRLWAIKDTRDPSGDVFYETAGRTRRLAWIKWWKSLDVRGSFESDTSWAKKNGYRAVRVRVVEE